MLGLFVHSGCEIGGMLDVCFYLQLALFRTRMCPPVDGKLYMLHRWLHKLLVYNITFLVSADVPDPTSSRQCSERGHKKV